MSAMRSRTGPLVKAARGLGVTRQALSGLVNEKTGISVEAIQIRRSRLLDPQPGDHLHIRPFQGTSARSTRRIGRPPPARRTGVLADRRQLTGDGRRLSFCA